MNRLPDLDRSVIVLDGGLATELERRGRDISGPLWSARVLRDAPEAIESLHYDYFAAGAQVAISASYQAPQSLLQRSVDLAVAARSRCSRAHGLDQRELFVAASVGPYGAHLHDGSEYRGNYGVGVERLIAFHEPRIEALARSGADLLACETIPSLIEVEALLGVLARFPEIPAWISFTTPDGVRSSEGQPLTDCARRLDSVSPVVALGVNCLNPDLAAKALRALQAGTSKPLVVYPNSGEHWNAKSEIWTGRSSECGLADQVPAWIAAGARLIGGCCRTGPAEIARMRAVCDGVQNPLR